MNLLQYQNFYLVGIKGVGMTALASCLVDAQKTVEGCDVAQDFVTAQQLKSLNIEPDIGFEKIPDHTEVVVYTAAHQASQNPLVLQAKKNGLVVMSHAQALAELFNQKQGIAVAGVGGKSTISAMLSFIFDQLDQPISYLVGVGEIPGLKATGRWQPDSQWFIAEADDYTEDPILASQGQFKARFSYLKPRLLIVSKIKFDHPDVYRNFEDTKAAFKQLFQNTAAAGLILCHDSNRTFVDEWIQANEIPAPVKYYGRAEDSDYRLLNSQYKNGVLQAKLLVNQTPAHIELNIPGEYNLENALVSLAASIEAGLDQKSIISALSNFKSTKRRFEYVGKINQLKIYDDYAHHPHEVEAAIQTLEQMYPQLLKTVAFQPHTYSRTKELFDDFVQSLSRVDNLILLNIFASAREKADDSVSSDLLAAAIQQIKPSINITRLENFNQLQDWILTNLKQAGVLLTMGAGDIYLGIPKKGVQ